MITADFPFKSAPRITRDSFSWVIRRYAADGLVAERDPGQYFDVIVATKDDQGRHVDPLFMLAMFNHESSMGTKGAAVTSHSWGNTRPPSFGVPQLGQLTQYKADGSVRGFLSTYRDWLDGCKSTAARLVARDWVYANRVSIRSLFADPSGDVWAPAGDDNDPEGYLRAVLDFMNAHADSLEGTPMVNIPKPDVIAVSGVTNMDGYAGTRRIEAIVNHITDDRNVQGTLSWFKNPASKASSNYLIDTDGTIYEVVPPLHAAWTNGAVNDPDTSHPLIAKWLAEGINFNMRTVTKEFVGKGGDTFTDAQINASNRLDAWLSQVFGFPLDRTHMLGHYQIDSVNRPYCPGQSDAVWQRLVEGAQKVLAAGGSTNLPANTTPSTDADAATGKYIATEFQSYYDTNGGLDIFGHPVSGAFNEDGRLVQYFERNVFQLFPENKGTKYEVQLRLLGTEELQRRYPDGAPA